MMSGEAGVGEVNNRAKGRAAGRAFFRQVARKVAETLLLGHI
jgi:hypothetical protein